MLYIYFTHKTIVIIATTWCIVTMLYTISIIAQKGGSGKTTLALTLAVAVEQTSRTTVVLDTDSQATACKWSAWRAAETPLVLAVQPDRLQSALATAAAHGVDMVVIDTPPGPSSRRWKRLVSPIWWLFPAAHNATTLRRSPRRNKCCHWRAACPPSSFCRRWLHAAHGPTKLVLPNRLWASRLPSHSWLQGRRR